MGVFVFPWKLIPSISTEVNRLQWNLPPISMEVNLRPFTSMEVTMGVASFSIASSTYLHESFHLLTYAYKLRPTFMQVAPPPMEATNYFHVRVLPSTSMELGSWPDSMEVAPA